MPRRRKSLEELIVDLNHLKSSYQQQGYNINELRRNYREWKNAKIFMNRNKNLEANNPRILIHQQQLNQNHNGYLKYRRIDKLVKKIEKLRQELGQNIIRCDNCKRMNHDGLDPSYMLTFHNVTSSNVRVQGTFKHVTSSNGNNERAYTLCSQCNRYLIEKDNDQKSIWPSFLWHILSMGNNSDFMGYYRYYTIYSGEHLWSLIPTTMRYWWIDAVKRIFLKAKLHMKMLLLIIQHQYLLIKQLIVINFGMTLIHNSYQEW